MRTRIQEIVASHGATFFNDHIALRSLALQVDSECERERGEVGGGRGMNRTDKKSLVCRHSPVLRPQAAIIAMAPLESPFPAFRPLTRYARGLQDPNLGISSISRLFEALGYRAAECYGFEDKVHISISPSFL